MVIMIKEFIDLIFNVGINSSGKKLETLENIGTPYPFKNISRNLELGFIADDGIEQPMLAYDDNGFLYIIDEEKFYECVKQGVESLIKDVNTHHKLIYDGFEKKSYAEAKKFMEEYHYEHERR